MRERDICMLVHKQKRRSKQTQNYMNEGGKYLVTTAFKSAVVYKQKLQITFWHKRK